MIADEPMALARRLCAEAALAPPGRLIRLTGGRNSRIWRIDLTDGARVVLKIYFRHPGDPRDRLLSERMFLDHAWAQGVRVIARPILAAPDDDAMLLDFIAGRRLEPAEIHRGHVEAAADFVVACNAPPRATDALPVASESCFTLAAHLQTVERRVARLEVIDAASPVHADAARWIDAVLRPTWRRVRDKAMGDAARMGLDVDASLDDRDVIVSPSDLGFHNALIGEDGILRFHDFEYAGRDDPAKLVCDFLCQPEIPVTPALGQAFQARLFAGLDLEHRHAERVALLLDTYRVKWACIMLNEFLPHDAARRAFAAPAPNPDRAAAQLAKARGQLERFAEPGVRS